MTESNTKNTYDETPYRCYPYSQSSPERLATLGALFGMKSPKIETARVLELGCAEGGNIIPHAVYYPKGQYAGVDLSKVQIESGQKNIKAMGLKNIELKHCSITDIDESFGKFDYIVCHGVISWVPDFVRDKIFDVVRDHLTESGIAYISYNTLPGWNMIRTIRDMMLYHSKNFQNPNEKVSQSRALLNFVKDSLKGAETPYAKVMSQEAEFLSKQDDHYLRHDHLQDENKQYYFNEFVEEAGKRELQYLSDCSLASMYLGNMAPSIVEKLQGINDIVRTEQYMDFITNRRFRSTLLCHKRVKLDRALNNEHAKKFALSFDVTPEKELGKIDLESDEALKFYFKGSKDQNIGTRSPWLKAILYVFVENRGYPLSFKSIVDKANQKFKANRQAQIENDLLQNAMNLIIKGYVEISLVERDKGKIKLDKPELTEMASYQANHTNNSWLTNNVHAPIGVDFFDKFALKYMNGKNTKKQILDHLIEDAKAGQITLNQDNKKVEDQGKIKEILSAHLDNSIMKFSMQGVFK